MCVDEWKLVIFADDCFACEDCLEPVCPVCNVHCAECECPGPTQDDEYAYKEVDGIMYARKLENPDD